MKLIKLITAVVMSFGLMIAQPPTQGGNQGGTQGPPPCDQWLNSDMAHDMNDDGVVDEGDCPGQGGPPQGPPPCDEWLNSDMAHDMNDDGIVDENDCPQQGPNPFQQAFMTTMQNGGTPDEAFEAVAAVFHQMEVECDDCEMTEEEFQEGKAEAKAAFDAVLANGGTPEEAFHAAMEAGNDGPGTCDVCGYEYGGEDDHHGHCRVCDAEMNADEDWQAHCEENPDHCKAQAGDVCGFRGGDGQGEECGYVHTGDPDEDHHHCDHCGLAVNSGEEMHNHMQADHPDMMEQHEDDGGDHDGPPPTNHWDGNCGAMMNGESEYWLDSDGDPDNGPEDGPYAVWHEDADGNPVNCGPGPDHDGEGDHDDQGGKCGYDGCEFVGNSDEEWHEHCEANPEHCPDPVADTFFTTYAETQDYEAAFNAGAAVAQEMAQNEDDYNEDEWNEGRDCFHAAMTSYLDGGGDSPQGAMDAMYESGCDDDGDDGDDNDQN